MVGAVILAAGKGRRMGGQPKALLTIEGKSFLAMVASACRDGGCDSVWVVTAAGMPEITELSLAQGARATINRDPDRGMFSSVRDGLKALLSENQALEGAVIFPVDHPGVSETTIRAMIDALARKPEKTWVQPVYNERRGHPILVDTASARALLALSPTLLLRDALEQCGLKPYEVDVEDPGILKNLNSPADLK